MPGNTMPAAPVRMHEAGFYSSDAEFRAMILAWVQEGVAAGEPVIIGYDERKSALLRSWLPSPAGVTFLPAAGQYASPARSIATWRRNYVRYLADGVTRIRAAGDVPNADDRDRFAGWDRYEMALNTVWDGMPVWSRCLYDATTTPDAVRDVVEQTHPRLLDASGDGDANARYRTASAFQALAPAQHPITMDTAPALDLADPTPAAAREAVARAGRDILAERVLDDLTLGVSEAITNAGLHGEPPVTMRVWLTAACVVVHLCDSGPGTSDPLAGLVAAESETGAGLGLWITHQLDLSVDLLHAADGFTVQLIARTGTSGR